MSAAASFISKSGPSLAIRNMAAFSKPQIEILLAGSERSTEAYVDSYSTLDEIKGVVKIMARHDTRFDDLEIAFVGEYKQQFPSEKQLWNDPIYRRRCCRRVRGVRMPRT